MGDHRDLHVLTRSFPTRLSAELADPALEGGKFIRIIMGVGRRRGAPPPAAPVEEEAVDRHRLRRQRPLDRHQQRAVRVRALGDDAEPGADRVGERSEEHTSELQSLMRNSYAVFCLKKKKK